MKNREIKKAVKYLQLKGIKYSKRYRKCTEIYFRLANDEKIRVYVVDGDVLKYGAMPLKRFMPKLMIYNDKVFSHRDVVMVGLEFTTIDIQGDD